LDSLLKLNGPIVFSAADSQASFSMALYLGAGGNIVDAQGRPELNSDILAKELAFFMEGSQKGVFPPWTTQVDADNQVWQAYREQRAPAAITWISHYLSSFPPDTTAAPLPSSGQASLTLATGWSWALGNPRTERHALAVKLAEYLVQSDFMAKWTAAAGYLPTRPTALAAWQDQSLQPLLSQVELSAQARPASEILSSLGPVMRDATLQVMKEQTDPNQVAQTAAERLKGH
jgi:multiple sugar transport system substrate-binding protein